VTAALATMEAPAIRMPRRWPQTVLVAVLLALFAFAIFGPLANLLLWAFAEKWYFPSKLPSEYGFSFWVRVFNPRGDALASLGTSVWIAVLTVIVSLAVAIPAGYALARLKLPFRALILLLFLLPQAVPNMPIYVNIARVFYEIGLNGTVIGEYASLTGLANRATRPMRTSSKSSIVSSPMPCSQTACPGLFV